MRAKSRTFLVLLACCFLLWFGRAEKTSDGKDPATFVEQLVQHNDVVVFAKSYCPYCKHTQKLLEEVQSRNPNLKVEFIWLDQMFEEDGPRIQMALLTKTGQKTVPNIFVGGGHVGGDSHITDLYNSGELQRMLDSVAAAKK